MRWVLLFLLLLAACTQPQLVEKPRPLPPTTVEAAPEPPTEVPQEETIQEERVVEDAPRAALEEIQARGRSADYDVAYREVSIFDGRQEEVQVATTVQGCNHRTSRQFTIEELDFESIEFIIDEQFIPCGVQEGEWSCLELEQENVPQSRCTLSGELPAELAVARSPSRSVLETRTSCFTITLDAATLLECFSPEGVFLYGETTTPNATVTTTATHYSLTVPPGAFTLPATPQPVQN